MSGFRIKLKIVSLKEPKPFFCVSLSEIWLLLETYNGFAFPPNIERHFNGDGG